MYNTYLMFCVIQENEFASGLQYWANNANLPPYIELHSVSTIFLFHTLTIECLNIFYFAAAQLLWPQEVESKTADIIAAFLYDNTLFFFFFFFG